MRVCVTLRLRKQGIEKSNEQLIEEFLARGGKIRKLPAVNPQHISRKTRWTFQDKPEKPY